MNTARKLLRPLLMTLATLAVSSPGWAESTTQLSDKVQQLAQRDPAGGIMTFTAVLVVFLALLLLVLIFSAIGKFFQRENAAKTQVSTATKSVAHQASPEVLAAISMALRDSLGKPDEVAAAIALAMQTELETQHDYESYKLTIQHRPTQWNARIQGTRAYNH